MAWWYSTSLAYSKSWALFPVLKKKEKVKPKKEEKEEKGKRKKMKRKKTTMDLLKQQPLIQDMARTPLHSFCSLRTESLSDKPKK